MSAEMTDMPRDEFQRLIRQGIPAEIPPQPREDPAISRAPERPMLLSADEKRLALRNALRYFPARFHGELANEFARELRTDGRITMRRFRPDYPMHPPKTFEHQDAAVLALLISTHRHTNRRSH